MKYLLLVLLLSSCGIHISSDPLIVKHELDLSALRPYCEDKCKNDADKEACTINCINDFLEALGNVSR